MISTASVARPRRDPYVDSTSVEFRFRARRFAVVQQLIQSVLDEKGFCEILDLGGTEKYWKIGEEFLRKNRKQIRITLVNTEAEETRDRELFVPLIGSATSPSLLINQSFDVVHSNSVVEHVGQMVDMAAFASNVRRLAPRYFVQTPNYWFPYEPHFRVPGFQYLPSRLRVELIKRFRLGFFDRVETQTDAEDVINHHRLLTAGQMAQLFPEAEILYEKFLFLNKSVMAVRDTAAVTTSKSL